MGSFLTMSQFQTGVHTSNLFYTGSAQNLLCLSMAAELGAVVPNQFATWGMGALLPALIGTILTPIILYNMNPPLLKVNTTALVPTLGFGILIVSPLTLDEL
jgi:DASS family divalent anion:Na+ symporter